MTGLVETDNAAVTVLRSDRAASITVRVTEKLFSAGGVNPVETVSSVAYLQAEFPTECWNVPHFATTISGLISEFFVEALPDDPRIERVLWDSEDDVLRVWTVTSESDFALEEPIYKAQMEFIERFPTLLCDFLVIYRYGKTLDDIAPQGAHLLR